MSNVTRYDNDGHLDMAEREDGEFVSYDDYEATETNRLYLEITNNHLREQIQKLEETLSALRAGD